MRSGTGRKFDMIRVYSRSLKSAKWDFNALTCRFERVKYFVTYSQWRKKYSTYSVDILHRHGVVTTTTDEIRELKFFFSLRKTLAASIHLAEMTATP
jgi:hypothetical protein